MSNYAFIDSQNLNMATQSMGWNLNWRRFRKYLEEKHDVSKAYLFLGFMEENQELYNFLTEAGFELVYKPVKKSREGEVKGNIDAELVLQAMIDLPNYDGAVIVTGDGDFYALVKHLLEQGKLARLVVPNRRKYSTLLNDAIGDTDKISYLNELKRFLEYHKRPEKPETPDSSKS